MEDATKVSINMTRNMDSVLFIGLMAENISDTGRMENSMVGVNTICQVDRKRLESGLKARRSNG